MSEPEIIQDCQGQGHELWVGVTDRCQADREVMGPASGHILKGACLWKEGGDRIASG